jgi:hypothetical protein
MSWNWLDVVVILLALGQVGLMIYVAMILLRIKKGPVARLLRMVQRNVKSGTRLAQSGKKAGLASLPHVMGIRASLSLLPRSFRAVKFTDAPITYGSVRKPLALWGTLKASRAASKAVAKGDAKAKAVRSRSLAERMGLIPPIWLRIAPLLGYAGTALAVFRQVQEQLPEIRSRLLSAHDTD